jgi:hypothetical protein
MFTVWTNPESVTASTQVGAIAPGLVVSEFIGNHLAYIREDGWAILF